MKASIEQAVGTNLNAFALRDFVLTARLCLELWVFLINFVHVMLLSSLSEEDIQRGYKKKEFDEGDETTYKQKKVFAVLEKWEPE